MFYTKEIQLESEWKGDKLENTVIFICSLRGSYLKVAYLICQSQIVLHSYTFPNTQIQAFIHTQ